MTERRRRGGMPRAAQPKTAVRLPMYLRVPLTVEGEPATVGRLVRAVLAYDTAVMDSAEVVVLDEAGPFRRFAWDRERWARGDWEAYCRDDGERKAERARAVVL